MQQVYAIKRNAKFQLTFKLFLCVTYAKKNNCSYHIQHIHMQIYKG